MGRQTKCQQAAAKGSLKVLGEYASSYVRGAKKQTGNEREKLRAQQKGAGPSDGRRLLAGKTILRSCLRCESGGKPPHSKLFGRTSRVAFGKPGSGEKFGFRRLLGLRRRKNGQLICGMRALRESSARSRASSREEEESARRIEAQSLTVQSAPPARSSGS